MPQESADSHKKFVISRLSSKKSSYCAGNIMEGPLRITTRFPASVAAGFLVPLIAGKSGPRGNYGAGSFVDGHLVAATKKLKSTDRHV